MHDEEAWRGRMRGKKKEEARKYRVSDSGEEGE
jgi:hypothetical protein